MTSKASLGQRNNFHPLLHEILWTLRRYWWISFTGMLLFSVFTFVGKTLEGNEPEVFTLFIEGTEITIRIAAVVFGIFAAFCTFRYLWSRKESILYLSVGASRGKQFLLRYLFGFVSVALGILVPFLITYYKEFAEVGDDYFGLCAHHTTVVVSSLLLIALLAYTVTALVSVLCGSFLSALLSTAGIMAAPYAFLWGTQTMLGFYLFGTPLGETLLSNHLGAGLFTMYDKQVYYRRFSKLLLDRYAVIADSNGVTLAERTKAELATLPVARTTLLVVLMLGLAVIAGFAYCRRPAEHSGKTAVHPILSHTVAIDNGLCVASLVLTAKAPAEGLLGTAALTALFVVALILTAALLRLILIRDLKCVVRQYAIPCGTGFACLILTILLGTGWFGYSSYIPDAMDVESVTVSYNQNVTLVSNKGKTSFSRSMAPDFRGATMSGMSDGTNDYTFLYAHGFELNDYDCPEMTLPEDIEVALSIHEAIVTDGRKTFTGQTPDEFSETVVPVYYSVTYTLKNGKTVERYYPFLTLATLEKTVESENTWGFREEIAAIHADMGFTDATTIEIGDPYFADFTAITLSEEDRHTLAAAMDLDNALMMAEDRYFSTDEADKVVGIIRIRTTISNRLLGTHPSDRKYETFYVTASWENTLAFLRERGLDTHFSNEYTITDVRTQRYTPRYFDPRTENAVSYVFHSCENAVQIRLLDGFSSHDLTDAVTRATDPVPADKWDAYLTASRPVALMTRPGVLVQIILTNADGETRLVTRYLYDTDMPA